jgi:pentatricopeptide repeat protein
VTYNSVISKTRDWRQARTLVADMRTRGLKPDAITYVNAMRACLSERSHEAAVAALTLHGTMCSEGVPQSPKTLAAALAAAAGAGAGVQAVALLENIRACGGEVRHFYVALHLVCTQVYYRSVCRAVSA